jgi:S-adenosylmethionine-dependent methyltransferase
MLSIRCRASVVIPISVHKTTFRQDWCVTDAWEPLVAPFVDEHYGSLRGQVRTHVIDSHLRSHLVPPPARLVDVGGGAGHQSFPLARRGYDVTIVDPSEAMLARADSMRSGERADVAERIHLVHASCEEAPEIVGRRQFAGVLCHGVIMYVEDPRPFVTALAALAAPGAIISVAAKNAAALAVRPALRGDWASALAAFGSSVRQVNGLGVDTRADTVDGLTDMFADSGVDRVAWYGVRLFTDGWTADGAADDREEVLQVELEASRRDPYRAMSRMFHFVGVAGRAEVCLTSFKARTP